MSPQFQPDGRCAPVPSPLPPLDIEAFCAHPCAPDESLTLNLFPFLVLPAGIRQVIIMQEVRGIGKGCTPMGLRRRHTSHNEGFCWFSLRYDETIRFRWRQTSPNLRRRPVPHFCDGREASVAYYQF